MIRLIASMLLLVAFGVFAALNVANRAAVNVFGYRVDDTSVVLVIVLSFAVGSVTALIACLSNRVISKSREQLKERRILAREREQQLRERRRDLDRMVDSHAKREAQTVSAELVPAKPRRRLLGDLRSRLGRRKGTGETDEPTVPSRRPE